MTFLSGVFNTTQNPAELNARSFAGTMLRLFPNGTFPLFGLLSQTGKSTAKASTHGYFSKTMTFGSVQINHAAYVAAETTLVVDSTTGITPFMVLYNPTTRENMRVITVDSATQITVTRAFGRVATANIADDQVLIVVGSAFAEGSARPSARGMATVYVPNYTQIFRNAWALTDTARASLAEQGFSNIAENRRDCSLLHSTEAESAIFLGQPKMDTTGTQPVHATQGIYDACDQYAPSHTNTAAATTTYSQLVTLVEPAYEFSTDMGNAKQRVAFVGATAHKVLNDIGRMSGQVVISQEETSFGMQFTSFKFYKGNIAIIEHPLFNAWSALSGLMVIVDLAALKLAYLNGRDTKPEEYGGDGKNNAGGEDSVGGSLTTEFAVELINPYACAVVEGLTAAAA
jgi:hypothetical protein